MSSLTRREREVLSLVRDDPLISQQAIADALDISRSAVAGYIMKLTAKGALRGRGYVVNNAPYVVAIGGANMDIVGRPDARIRSRDSNPGRVSASPGGVARNIAENLARLGVDCRLIAPLGKDHYGDVLIRHGRDAGIDMRHVLRLDGLSTSSYVSVLDESGDMRVAISDMKILDALDASQLEKHGRALLAAEALVIDLNLSDSAIRFITGHCADRPLFVDTVSTTKASRIRPYLASVHTLFPSRIEAEALTGFHGRKRRSVSDMASWLHDEGVDRVFITLGQDGVFYSDGTDCGTLPPLASATTVNANGAGDAFAAGVVAAWLDKKSLRECVQFGTAAACHTLQDAATVSRTMSEATLLKHWEDSYAD